jgi:hypothetical protein
MALAKVTDHAAQAVARFVAQFKSKPDLASVISIFSDKIQELEEVFFQLLNERALDVAVGQQLDNIGKIVGLDRNGLDDAKYRSRLAGHIKFLISSGTPENVLAVVFNASFEESALQYIDEFLAGFTIKALDTITVGGPSLAALLNNARPAGVRSIFEWFVSPFEDIYRFDTGPGFETGYFATASDDGLEILLPVTVQWANRSNQVPTTVPLKFIYGGGVFVGVGADAKIIRSIGGRTWTAGAISGGGFGVGVVLQEGDYDGALFVAGGGTGGTGNCLTSPDGALWTQRTANIGGSSIAVIQHEPGVWLLGGSAGVISTSPTGITWTARASLFGANTVRAFASKGSTIVAVGDGGKISYSTDVGATWLAAVSGIVTRLRSVVSNSSGFVAAGDAGVILTSPDGIAWTARTSGFGASDIYEALWVPELLLFVAVGQAGKISTSLDGITWTARTSGFGASDIQDVFFGDGLLFAAGNAGKAATSSDGITWVLEVSVPATGFTAGVFGESVAVVGGGSLGIGSLYTRRTDL